MAHLNQRERTELAEQLAGMKFKKAQGKVRGLDHNGRLAYFRNQQTPTRLLTRYTLPTLGVVITSRYFNVRTNRAMAGWSLEALPADYPAIRARWDRVHSIRTCFGALGLAGYLTSVILR